MTIFEIKEKKTKNSDLSNAANVMRQLKSKNSHIIEKFKGKNFLRVAPSTQKIHETIFFFVETE